MQASVEHFTLLSPSLFLLGTEYSAHQGSGVNPQAFEVLWLEAPMSDFVEGSPSLWDSLIDTSSDQYVSRSRRSRGKEGRTFVLWLRRPIKVCVFPPTTIFGLSLLTLRLSDKTCWDEAHSRVSTTVLSYRCFSQNVGMLVLCGCGSLTRTPRLYYPRVRMPRTARFRAPDRERPP